MIRWDQNEFEKLVTTVTTMRLNDPVTPIVTLINHAQKQLPADRRREIRTVQNCKPLVEAIKLATSSLVHDHAVLCSEKQSLTDKLKSANQKISDLEFSSGFGLDKFSTLELAEEITNRIKMFAGDLTQVSYVPVVRKLIQQDRPVDSEGRTHICVSGPLEKQQQEIRKHFGDEVKFRFVLGSNPATVPDGFDHYINWVSFSNHAVNDRMKHASSGNMHLVKGGLQAVIGKIKQLLGK